jgi:hypothetical protein
MKIISKNTIKTMEGYEDIPLFLDVFKLEPQYEEDEEGKLRFKPNSVIKYLLDYHKIQTMMTCESGGLAIVWEDAEKGEYTLREMIELYIHMGYSLCGFTAIFGEAMDKVLNIERDDEGGVISKYGPSTISKEFVDQPI